MNVYDTIGALADSAGRLLNRPVCFALGRSLLTVWNRGEPRNQEIKKELEQNKKELERSKEELERTGKKYLFDAFFSLPPLKCSGLCANPHGAFEPEMELAGR